MIALRLASLPVTAAIVALGVWIAGGWISDDFRVSMALTGAWLAIAAVGCAVIARRVRPLRIPVALGYVLAAGAICAYLGLTTLRDRVVDEQVVTAAPAAAATDSAERRAPPRDVELLRARFRSHEHATEGTAAIVRLADGRRFVTLTQFATSPGPDLRVRLVPGDSADGGAPGNVDLGALKGNRGNQQYAIPAGVRVSDRTLVIWCRAFSAPFGSARLV
jgi:Electron transfer DM13